MSVHDAELLAEARRAAAAAYVPYSGFRVGAAVLRRAARAVRAPNVLTPPSGVPLCAERAALGRAVGEGARPGDVEAMAVTASPCGACRQWLHEFRVGRVLFEHDGVVLVRTVDELLPDSFDLE